MWLKDFTDNQPCEQIENRVFITSLGFLTQHIDDDLSDNYKIRTTVY